MSNLAGVTIESLLRALNQVEMQAVVMLAEGRSGSTHDVADLVQRQTAQLADLVRDEIKALRRYGLLEAK